MGIGQSEHARLVLAHQLGHVLRVLRRLREQSEQLGKQIAGAMAQLADHQLVAFLELPALDGAGDEIADGGKERGVLGAERPPLAGADAENAIGAAVAAGDGRAHAADAAVILKILWHGKACFGRKIGDDDGNRGVQGVAGVVAVLPRGDDRADEARLPAAAGAQEKVGVAGQELQNFDEIDRQGRRHRMHHVVEQRFEIAFRQGTLAELSERLLLFDAAAQLAFQIYSLAHVMADADHALRHAIGDGDRSGRLDPAILAGLPRRHPVAHPIGPPAPQRLIEAIRDVGPILFVDVAFEECGGAVEAAGSKAVNQLKIARPRHHVGGDIPGPDADASGFKRGAQRRRIREEFLCGFCRRRPFRFGRCVRPFCVGPVHVLTIRPPFRPGQGRASGFFGPMRDFTGPSPVLLYREQKRWRLRGAAECFDQTILHQTMQRRKTCAKSGEEIGLKARSQPKGICARERACTGAPGASAPCSSGQTVGREIGSRSPLRVRLTDSAGEVAGKAAPVVGIGNEINPAVNNASDRSPTAPATRTDNTDDIVPIGMLRQVNAIPLVPICVAVAAHPPQATCIGVRGSTPGQDFPLCDADAHSWVITGARVRALARPRANFRAEQTVRSRLIVGTGHPFPPPPVLGRPIWAQPMDRSAAP